MRPSRSWIASKRPIGTWNCSRTRAYMPVVCAVAAHAAADSDGSEMPRPAASALISIFQPLPACSTPPMMWSIGMNTSRPEVGPF